VLKYLAQTTNIAFDRRDFLRLVSKLIPTLQMQRQGKDAAPAEATSMYTL
jgi:hypothetical protein